MFLRRDLLCKCQRLLTRIASEIVKRKLEIKELGQAGVQVQGCTIKICKSVQDMVSALMEGNRCKARGETLMNRDSSRSHCIFTIFVETAVAAAGVSYSHHS